MHVPREIISKKTHYAQTLLRSDPNLSNRDVMKALRKKFGTAMTSPKITDIRQSLVLVLKESELSQAAENGEREEVQIEPRKAHTEEIAAERISVFVKKLREELPGLRTLVVEVAEGGENAYVKYEIVSRLLAETSVNF